MNRQLFVVFVAIIGVFIRTSTAKYLLVEVDGENEISEKTNTSTKNCKDIIYHRFVTSCVIVHAKIEFRFIF